MSWDMAEDDEGEAEDDEEEAEEEEEAVKVHKFLELSPIELKEFIQLQQATSLCHSKSC